MIGVTGYLINIVRHLESDQPVYGVQSPAFCGLGDPIESVEETSVYFLDAIRQVQPEGPYLYLLGGHSSGVYVAYENGIAIAKRKRRSPSTGFD